MKKLVSFILFSLCFFSCKNFENFENNEINITENSIEKVYYKKDSTNEFKDFLKLPEIQKNNFRSMENDKHLTNEDLFSLMWQDLSEEEKTQLIENSGEVYLQIESGLEVPIENEISKSVLNGNTNELDFLAANFSFSEHLKDWFGNTVISIDLLPEEYFPKVEDYKALENILLANVIENLSYNENWNIIKKILTELCSDISVSMIKKEYEKIKELDSEQNQSNASRAALVTDFYYTSLADNFGATLNDGTVLLTAGKKKAFIIAGNWTHAGIFSRDAYLRNGGIDSAHCVYTAQPDDAKNGPSDVIPDRPGYTCLDTIYMYTKQKRMAAILPKNYSIGKGKAAVNYAKNIFYDAKEKYCISAWELFLPDFMSSMDTSHNEKSDFPYCSKVAYTAWKKAGEDIDAETFAGCLVSPDDLYSSSFDRYKTFTIGFLFWSKTWKYKVYSATSNVVKEASR